jgi:methionyl aminopeptidase
MIIVKSPREVTVMREAGRMVAKTLNYLGSIIKPGITTMALDEAAAKMITSFKAVASFKGYGGYPASICASVNDTLIHGIPSNQEILKDGDIIKVDIGIQYKGYHADAARTYLVGNVGDRIKQLVDVTTASFFEAFKVIRPGIQVGDISHTIQAYVEKHGSTLPEDYTGHGVGQNLHEDPQIPNFGRPGTGPILKTGMTLAIEPMVNLGKKETRVLKDGWTVKTKDGKWCAHYENTIVITDSGAEILTLEEGGSTI